MRFRDGFPAAESRRKFTFNHIFNFKEPHFPGLKMSALYN